MNAQKCKVAVVLLLVFAACESAGPTGLADTVRDMNEKCPVMIDSETRLDRMAVEDGNTLAYYHTLVNLSAEVADTARLRRELTPGLLANIRVNPALEPLRADSVGFRYYYNGSNGKPLLMLAFSRRAYASGR